ncbi:hypothetical protein BH11CYA1_BH11CYA1_35980 [soil metagenome]
MAIFFETVDGDVWIAKPHLSFGGKEVRTFQNSLESRAVVEIETNQVPLPSQQVELFKELLLAPVNEPDGKLLEGLPDVFGKIIVRDQFSLESFSVGYLKQHLAVRISGLWNTPDLATITYFLLDYSNSTLIKVAYKAPSEQYRLYETAASDLIFSLRFDD